MMKLVFGKIALSFLIFLAPLAMQAQVTFDPGIVRAFHEALLRIDSAERKEIENLDAAKTRFGLAVFGHYQLDTLNRTEITRKPDVVVSDIEQGAELPPQESAKYISTVTKALRSGDTLWLTVGMPFHPHIVHRLLKGRLVSSYELYRKQDTVFRLRSNEPLASGISVPLHIRRFVLNTGTLKPGSIIYGSVAFESSPWYEVDLLSKGMIRLRLRGRYYFKTRVNTRALLDREALGLD